MRFPSEPVALSSAIDKSILQTLRAPGGTLTLGFRLDSAKEISVFGDHAEPDHQQIDDLFASAWSLVDTLPESQASQHLHSDHWQRTISIDALGVRTTDFGLDDTK